MLQVPYGKPISPVIYMIKQPKTFLKSPNPNPFSDNFLNLFQVNSKASAIPPPTESIPSLPVTRAPDTLKSCSNCKVKKEVPKLNPLVVDALRKIPQTNSVLNQGSKTVAGKPSDVPIIGVKSNEGSVGLFSKTVAGKPLDVPIIEGRVGLISKTEAGKQSDVPIIRVKSNEGSIGLISPMNVVLGISTAGVQASEQIKSKHNAAKTASVLKPSQQVQIKSEQINPKGKFEKPSEVINSGAKKTTSPSIAKASQQIQTKSEEKVEIKSTKTTNSTPSPHPISKPVRFSNVTIPVSLQTKSEISAPIATAKITSNKPVESSQTHLSSKEAINEFIGDVLYRFNYTAGYHGHNEEGDSAGNKRGGYFIVGRDNIRRGVIYVANENGFAPVVKYEKVSPAEAPHEDTEKSAGLKGYKFEWFDKGKSQMDSLKANGR